MADGWTLNAELPHLALNPHSGHAAAQRSRDQGIGAPAPFSFGVSTEGTMQRHWNKGHCRMLERLHNGEKTLSANALLSAGLMPCAAARAQERSESGIRKMSHLSDESKARLRVTELTCYDKATLGDSAPEAFNVIFPDETDGRARIKRCGGRRILEWSGEQWMAFERESGRWFPDELGDADYEVLQCLLPEVI